MHARLASAVLASLLLVAACAPSEGGRSLYVEPASDGEWDDPASMALVASFTTIQDAVDAASPGDTVEIPSGTYNEFVALAPGVSLHGAGQGQTIVEGRIRLQGGSGMSVTSLTVECVSSTGLYVTSTDGLFVQDVEITGCSTGFLLEDNATGAVLDDLYLHGNTIYGGELQGVWDVTLSNSLLISNGYGGVNSTYTDGLIVHNTVVGNGFAASPSHVQGGVILDDAGGDLVANNIITGNSHGIECDGCTGSWSSNLVWGNTVQYAGEASAGPGDLSVQPGFVDASEGDYHLAAGSEAIDVGDPASSVATDADGETRPVGAGPDLGLDEFAPSGLSLVLTEVLANPTDEATGEFIEVLNAGSVAIDLAGLLLSDGDQQDVLEAWDAGTTVVEPGSRAVVVDPPPNWRTT